MKRYEDYFGEHESSLNLDAICRDILAELESLNKRTIALNTLLFEHAELIASIQVRLAKQEER